MTLYRYSSWDGTQDLSSIDEDDLVEQVSGQLMAHSDLPAALRSVVQRGVMVKSGQRMLPGSQRRSAARKIPQAQPKKMVM